MGSETTQFGEASNAREYLEALEQAAGIYAALREDVEEIAERLVGLDLSQRVILDLDAITEALSEAHGAAENAHSAFMDEYGDLLEFVESGKNVPGLDPFFGES